MITQTHILLAQLIEDRMVKTPTRSPAVDRLQFDDAGEFDELKAANVCVQIERMNDNALWLSIEDASGNAQVINVSARGRISVTTDTETYQTMAKAPIKLKGIRAPGVRLKDGKLVKVDKAPPHAKAARRRKAGKVTGVRAAK